MADPVLKFPPDQKPLSSTAAEPRRGLMAGLRRHRRTLLLVVLPLFALIGGNERQRALRRRLGARRRQRCRAASIIRWCNGVRRRLWSSRAALYWQSSPCIL